jgi:tetraacyldisaccharide 4'-kinase
VLTRPLGFVWGALSAVRARAYAGGLLPAVRLRGPVISVGNLSVGGNGKTPVVARIAAVLRDAGRPVAILSRGYGGDFDGDALIVADGQRVLADARLAGDEPVMLAQELPGVVVAVGPRRDAVGQAVEARFGPRVHVLDDGFQHLRLRRDLDLLCLDPRDLEDHPLPTGRLREWPSAAARADLVLLTGGDDLPEAAVQGTALALGAHRTHRVTRRLTGFLDERGNTVAAPRRPFLLAAIARPERFLRDAAKAGASPVGHRFFRDHHRFLPEELSAVAAAAVAALADAVLTTAKDLVRLDPARLGLPVRVLAFEAEISDEPRFWERVLAVARRPAS